MVVAGACLGLDLVVRRGVRMAVVCSSFLGAVTDNSKKLSIFKATIDWKKKWRKNLVSRTTRSFYTNGIKVFHSMHFRLF